MKLSFWEIVVIIVLFSLISSLLVVLLFLKKKKTKKKEILKEDINNYIKPYYKLKIWWFFEILWPLMCFIFAAIIIFQSIKGMEERIFDAMFALIPLIFFEIGMIICYRLLKECRYTTTLTTATVISVGKRTNTGKRKFFPEYEFQIDKKTYKVTSQIGYSICYVKEGKQVKLYYSPKNPKLFYVPIMHKHDKRWSMLLCGIGIIYPLIGLFAPLFREMFAFLT